MGNPLQQTHEWFEARCGCLTASRVACVLERQKNGKPYKAYFDMVDTLIQERITGEIVSVGTTFAMQWGIDHEDEAREMYEATTGNVVELTGFILHPQVDFLGASPDGLVGDDGLVEIKCPNTATHLRRWKANVVPDEYKPQMLLQLLVTGRKWVDFVDYDPRLTDEWAEAKFFCVRFQPEEAVLAEALEKCKEFLQAVDSEMQEFKDEYIAREEKGE